MVPKITRGGTSFKSAFRYYLHDKGADTAERVEWAQAENMRTADPAKAWKVMAYTAREQERLKEASGQSRAGRKLEKPVFAFSLAWHPEQTPTQAHMLETARRAIETLGLSEHETMIVAHRDEPQKHVHVIVNRVHPLTGLAGDVSNSKRKLSDFARTYEHETGKIYCAQREENHKKRQQGKATRYGDPHIVEAWQSTDCGKSFQAALLARGYILAQGKKRIVVIDPHGKPHNPLRHLDGVKTKDLNARLSDLDIAKLPDADAAPVAQAPVKMEPEKPTAEAAPEPDVKAQALDDLAARLDALEKSQRAEADALVQQHTKRVAFAKRHLAEFYGLKERKSALVALKARIDGAPWWKKLLGLTRKDSAALREQIGLYRSAAGAYRQRVAAIVTENEQARTDLAARHAKARAALASPENILHHSNEADHVRNHPGQERPTLRQRAFSRAVAEDRAPVPERKLPTGRNLTR